MSDPVYLLHLVMGALIGGVGLACTISIQRESKADVQRLLDGLDAAVQAQNEFVEFYAQQHHQLVAELASQMHEQIKASERRLATHVSTQGSHTDDMVQRVMTRPEARVAK